MEEKYYVFKEEKEIGSRKKIRVRKTVYYLQEQKYGYRVEVTRSNYTSIVEVSLMLGGGTSQIRQLIAAKEVLKNPTKEQFDEVVKEYCTNATKLINEAINKRGN